MSDRKIKFFIPCIELNELLLDLLFREIKLKLELFRWFEAEINNYNLNGQTNSLI